MSMNDWEPAVADPRESQSRMSSPAGPVSSKGLGDYLKALKRRFWLVLLIALLIGGSGTVFTLFVQTPVYWASTRLRIEPPQTMVQGLGETPMSSAAAQNYYNTLVQLISSRQIAERVIKTLQLSDWVELNGVEDPVGELLGWIIVKPVKDSNLVDIGIEGKDPKLVAKIVNSAADEFIRYEQDGIREYLQLSRSKIDSEAKSSQAQLEQTKHAMLEYLKQNEKFHVTGVSMDAAKMQYLDEARIAAEVRLKDAKSRMTHFKSMIDGGGQWFSELSGKRLSDLKEQVHLLDQELEHQKEVLRPDRFDRDANVKRITDKRDELAKQLQDQGKEDALAQLELLKQDVKMKEIDLAESEKSATEQRKIVMSQQDDVRKLNGMQSEATRLESTFEFLAKEKARAEMIPQLMASRITIVDKADAPRTPIRPIKELQIPLILLGSLILGCMFVLGLEFMDHSIRQPEEASASLEWPLLGVVPRLSARDLTIGGKLRLATDSENPVMREAFRNLRMGVLGGEGKRQLRSILVSSAKPGEGKSVIAANLAATFARAGESVLLVDVDLRKPSQARYFGLPTDAIGLTDVLEGNVPWQKAVVPTETANLSVLPAGDATGVPVEILGTMEMHDLFGEWAQRFDRVILDGPAMLGLADSREVGRFADGVLFVVQSGSHDHSAYGGLTRIRQLFEHEGLHAAGVVFNGLKTPHNDLAASKMARLRTSDRPRRALEATAEPVGVAMSAGDEAGGPMEDAA